MNKSSVNLVAWLNHQLTELPPGSPLPTRAALAKTFGLAPVTVARVIKGYVDTGKLNGIRGKGTFIPQERKIPRVSVPPVRSSVNTIVETLTRALATGEIRQGHALPSAKYLCLQYKVAPATVRAAYAALQKKRLITRMGKGWWAGSFKHRLYPETRKPVYLFSYYSDDFSDIFKGMGAGLDNFGPAYTKVESELASYGYSVHYRKISRFKEQAAGWQKEDKEPAGVIFYGMLPDKMDELLDDLLTYVQDNPARTPVLIDCRIYYDKGKLKRIKQFNPNVRVLHRGTLLTAIIRRISHYLIEKKTGHAVVFMDLLRTFFGAAPLVAAMRLYAEVMNLDKRFGLSFVFKTYDILPDLKTQLQKAFNTSALERELAKYSFNSVQDFTDRVRLVKDIPLSFAGTPAKGTWAFTFDNEAAAGVEWLQKKGYKVPEDVAIMGLQNDPALYRHGFTSCVPDWDCIGYLMAHSLIGDITIERTRQGYIRTRARILERETTG